MTNTTPTPNRHVFIVRCQDGRVRHEGSFENRLEAATWAEYGHCCTRHHSFERVVMTSPRLFIPLTSIDRTIHTALTQAFGVRADLNLQPLVAIQDTIVDALLDAGRGLDEANESAQRLAARIEGMVLS